MRRIKRRSTRAAIWMTAALALSACGGEAADEAPSSREVRSASSASGAIDAASGSYERGSFVLCPALKAHRMELAAIVGFEQDAERGMAGVGAECYVRGHRGNYLRVKLAPAMMRSVSMAAAGYEAEVTPVPALGDEAAFVAGGRQPHVVFPMGTLIIDVAAENDETPSRETMVELALRVRELLVEANS